MKTRLILGIVLASALAAAPLFAGEDDRGFGRLLDLAKQAKGAKEKAADPTPTLELPEGLVRLTNSPGKKSSPCWSPDGEVLYYVDQGNGPTRILSMEIGGGEVDTIVSSEYWAAQDPAISPDGAYLAYQTQRIDTKNSIWIRRLEDGLEGKLIDATDSVENHPAWNRSGGKLYFNRRGPNSMHHRAMSSLRNGEGLKVVGLEQGNYYHPVVSPDGTEVAWIHRDGRDSKIVIINAKLNAITRDVRTPGYSIASMDWMPDGRRMIISYLDNSDPDHGFDLGVLDTDTGSVMHALNLGHYDSDPKVSPDGRSVVFSSNPKKVSEIFIWTLPTDFNVEDEQ